LILAFVIAMLANSAHAATITVNSLGDTLNNGDGVCTIREAIVNANNDAATWSNCAAGSGTDTINLPAGTITLTIPNTPDPFSFEDFAAKGDLDILTNMIINGNAVGTTINGGALDRIFDINPDTDPNDVNPAPPIVVAINNLTVTNGRQNQYGAVKVNLNGTATMDNCTVSNSRAWADDAGGVYNGGTLTMTNCTVSGNTAYLHSGGVKNDGVLALKSCTVTNNDSDFDNLSGGVWNSGGVAANATLRNTIVAGNGGVDCPNLLGPFTSLGYNVVGEFGTIMGNPQITATTGDQFDVSDASVMLGALTNNGGPTPTHALGAGSIAIDKGHSSGSTTDQRGEPRPCDQPAIANATGGDGADVGAFEVQGSCAGNSAPNAVDDTATLAEDSGGNLINVLANDSDPDMDTLTITAVTQGVNGSVINNGNSVTYSPNANFFGSDSFTYTIDDGNGNTDTATVNVTVTNVQDSPNANDDMATVAEDSGANVINVLANDVDVDGDMLSVIGVTQGANGSVANNGSSVSYTPNPDFFGSDSFTYTVADGQGGFDTATVNVTVTNVNDAPVANNDNYTMNQDTTLNVPTPGVLANDTDVDGDALTAGYVAGNGPNNGTLTLNSDGSFSYTPNAGFVGMDTFDYEVSDGTTTSNLATVTIKINDTQAPTVNCAEAIALLWPPNSDLINIGLTITATDNDGLPPTLQMDVFSDEDDEDQVAEMSPDAKDIAPVTLRLRAERRTDGDGRVYIIRIKATDSSNNTAYSYCTVVVPKSLSKADINSVNAQAAAAVAAFIANSNNPPAGYFVVGDGPVVGPKQ
jgi:CSLREA domain-containing protein